MLKNKKPLVPESQSSLEQFKNEVAADMGVDPLPKNQDAYLGDHPSKEGGMMGKMKNAGNVGGEMVKRMVKKAQEQMKE